MQKSLRNFKSEKCAEKRASEIVGEYSRMSEDALFAKLMEEVASQKSDGTFDMAELTENVNKMRPYLSAEQSAKLNHLLKLIGS